MLGVAMPPTKVKKVQKVSTKQSLLHFSVRKNASSAVNRKQQQGIYCLLFQVKYYIVCYILAYLFGNCLVYIITIFL